MRLSELGPVVADLQDLVGLPLHGAWQPARDRLVLGLGRDRWLLIVPRGPLARLHSLARRPANPERPFSFQGACRATLHGPLTALVRHPDDRVVDLVFGACRLHLRLTGRGGGLWLLRGEEVVAAYDGPAPGALPPLPEAHPLHRSPRFMPAPGEGADAAARRWFQAEEAARAVSQRRTEVRRALADHLDRSVRLVEALEADLVRAADAPRLRAQADTLAANLHRVPRGAAEIALADLEEPERTHRIALDPSLPASATMERLYKRAGRLDRVGDRVIEPLIETEARITALRDALAEVDAAPPERLELLRALAPFKVSRAREGPGDPWDTWIGPRGEEVLVGRNAKSNRALTFQRARGRDWWLHLRDRPGAHVVIPSREGHPPPKELLLAAAQLVLREARIADGGSADVQYTQVKNLRSVRGDPGARVLIADERVLHVRRTAEALTGWNRVDRGT